MPILSDCNEQTTVEQPLDLTLETELSDSRRSQTETAPSFIDVTWVRELLLEAAREAQVHYLHEQGENYSEQDLVNCFVAWFDSCLDELATYAFDLCVKDSLNTFNRYAFQAALLRIKPSEPEEPNPDVIPTMLSIQVPNDDGANLAAQLSQAKVGVLLNHLEKMRTQVDLIDLLEAFKALVENEKDNNEIRQENLDYAINRLGEAELAIRHQENWIAPTDWSACSCQNNDYSPRETLPH